MRTVRTSIREIQLSLCLYFEIPFGLAAGSAVCKLFGTKLGHFPM